MTIAQMLGQSGSLTLLGMGVVFGFLFILIVSVTVVGKIIHTLGLDKDTSVLPKPAPGPSTAAKTAAVSAAITAAVTEYRKTEGK
ncbi:MAG: OadG family protein [Treponema sp.]|nr:OadG family protein [Treponema sp.]